LYEKRRHEAEEGMRAGQEPSRLLNTEQGAETRTRARKERRGDQRKGKRGKGRERGIGEAGRREEEQRVGIVRLRGTEKGCQGR